MVSYAPLWNMLFSKRMKKQELYERCELSSATIARMGKNDYVSLRVLERICQAFDCRIEDIVEIRGE